MSFTNHRDIVAAELAGKSFFSTWRKQPTQTTGANIWFDLSMSPGNPVPNYYIGAANTFTRLAQSTDGGIPHGGAVSPAQKVLRMLEIQCTSATAAPMGGWLCDYLGFYPFVDESITEWQPMNNTLGLSRYTDGEGVQILPVVVAGHTGGQTFKVRYTSAGVSGRESPQHLMTTQVVNGTVLSSAGALANSRGPFMALAEGDTGLTHIDEVLFEGTGDIGLTALALVKPIARIQLRGIDAPVERDYLMEFSDIPTIEDDAYLNLVVLPVGSLAAAPIHGYIKTVFN